MASFPSTGSNLFQDSSLPHLNLETTDLRSELLRAAQVALFKGIEFFLSSIREDGGTRPTCQRELLEYARIHRLCFRFEGNPWQHAGNRSTQGCGPSVGRIFAHTPIHRASRNSQSGSMQLPRDLQGQRRASELVAFVANNRQVVFRLESVVCFVQCIILACQFESCLLSFLDFADPSS